MEPQKKLSDDRQSPGGDAASPRGPLYRRGSPPCLRCRISLRIRRTTCRGDAARIAAQEGGDYDTGGGRGGDGTL